jgi:hypothetical protein
MKNMFELTTKIIEQVVNQTTNDSNNNNKHNKNEYIKKIKVKPGSETEYRSTPTFAKFLFNSLSFTKLDSSIILCCNAAVFSFFKKKIK